MTDSAASRRLWLVSAGVLLVAAVLRLWELGTPQRLVFDEIYYVRDAISQLAHGFPTDWPDDDPTFTDPAAFTDRAAPIAHPPLGKWLIGLGVVLFGAESAWGWRIASAVAGIATVALTMRLGWLMTRSLPVVAFAGLVLALDGVHVVLSRVGLLDGFLTLLVVLGALLVWKDQASGGALRAARARAGSLSRLGPVLWRRPWLLAAGLTFGAAAAVKWSGLYPLAAFLLLITVRDFIVRRRIAERPVLGAARQALVTAVIALPAALIAYLATWIGWILHPSASGRAPGEPWWVSLWEWHTHTLIWHASLSADHPYRANPWSWPLALRPTGMYWHSEPEGPGCPEPAGCAAAISALPNPLVTWGGVLALLVLAWVVARALWLAARSPALPGRRLPDVRRRSAVRRLPAPLREPAVWIAAFVLVGYLSGWLPWVFTASRSAVFQFYAVVLTPFAALALGLVLGVLVTMPPAASAQIVFRTTGIRIDGSAEASLGRRISVVVFALAMLLLGLLFFPLWSAMLAPEWFWRAHLWLPGWR